MTYGITVEKTAIFRMKNGMDTLVVMRHDTASAASFMPFKNVINNANIKEAEMTKTNISRILNDDCSYCVGNILQYVARAFKCLSDVFVLDQFNIVGLVLK